MGIISCNYILRYENKIKIKITGNFFGNCMLEGIIDKILSMLARLMSNL